MLNHELVRAIHAERERETVRTNERRRWLTTDWLAIDPDPEPEAQPRPATRSSANAASGRPATRPSAP